MELAVGITLHHLSLSPAETQSLLVRLQENVLLINTMAFCQPGEMLLLERGGGFGSEDRDESPQVQKSRENV